MTNINLPISQGGVPVQVLSFKGDPTKIAVASSSARAALPTGAASGDVIRIGSTTDCYIVWGSSSIDADSNDHMFTSGVEYMTIPAGVTHLAAIRVAADGVLTLSLMD
tara:strand:- start:1228 stop:1551 length:324 start_codon:yes stop_codon:yes gene_type:complete